MILLNGDTFEAIWSLPIADIDEPNVRGEGLHRVGKLAAPAARSVWPTMNDTDSIFVKRQAAFFCRPLWNFGRRTPTLRRELRYLQRAARAGVRVPEIVAFGEATGGRAVLALKEVRGAMDLSAALAMYSQSRSEIFDAVAHALAALHHAGIYHGALYPKHLLVGGPPTFAVTLIDFEKARGFWPEGFWPERLWPERLWPAARATEADLARLFRHAPFLGETDIQHIRAAYRHARGAPR